MKIFLKKAICSIFVLCVLLGFVSFSDAATTSTDKVNGVCSKNYSTKTFSYSDFYSNWVLRKGASFCSTGTVDYQALNCVSSSATSDKCYYKCKGAQGGKTASCYFNLTRESLCGNAINNSFSSTPSKDICVSGSIPSVVEDRKSSWHWTCRKYNGILVSYCLSPKTCFKSGEFVSANQKCCDGLSFCPTSDTSTVGYCSEKCIGECSSSYEPVCGKDGRDYNNECMARRSGTQADFEGECKYKGVKCGVASEKAGYSLTDPANLCKYGRSSLVSGEGPWSWLCQSDKGDAMYCLSAKKGSTDGSCGDSNLKVLKQIPTTGLCKKGTASSIKGDVVWKWTCGSEGGKLDYCYAEREGFKVDGICNSPQRLTSGFIAINSLCSEGIPSGFAFSNDRWIWECKGTNGGKIASCSEKYIFNSFLEKFENGICGSINGTRSGKEPVSDFCKQGRMKDFYYDYNSGKWMWKCIGSGSGATVNCEVTYSADLIKADGRCGSASSEPSERMPLQNLCTKGNPMAVSGTGPWSWTCKGISGGSDARCTAKRATATNGLCGQASKGSYISIPTADLCSVGLASSVTGDGPWYWTCSGSYGGKDVQCSGKLVSDLTPRTETEKYMMVDLWVDKDMKKGIRVSVKDYGVNVFMEASAAPYRTGVGPEKQGNYELVKATPADGWTDAYFYLLPEDNRKDTFCFDAWYKIDWMNGKLSNSSQFYSKCIKLSVESFVAPAGLDIKLYPVLKGAIVLSLWTDSDNAKKNPTNYSTIIIRNKGVVPIVPEKKTTLSNSVLGDCNLDNTCPQYDLVLGNNNKRIVTYLPKGNYCYTAWTRYCQGYFCENSTNNLYWCFGIK
ncbi:MAG: Kazal-type serine protease inhibitor family protein [Candidatus Pacebacteria bacterium]|nr:Kazal-type serine protease inhibitor family protein [Candidatus Paceibacterota bacterium]